MNLQLNLKKSIFNDTYYPYLFSYSDRYEIYYGGAGSGKSHFITQKLLLKCLAEKRKLLVIRKVGRTIKDSVFQLFLDILAQFRLTSYCSINRTTFTIELPNSSIILFKGLDDSEKIKSITAITDIWVEEATELTQDDFTQLDLRLRAKQPHLQFLLSFNPVSKTNWCFRYWFAGEPPTGTFILKTTYRDNHFLPAEYVASLEAMKQTNPTYYRIYALGEFCSLDRLIYTNWRIKTAEDNVCGQILIGLDFGYINDPTSLVISYLDEENKRIYIEDEYYKVGMLNNEIADLIQYKNLQKEVIIADSAEQKSIEEIKRAGVPRIRPATKGQGSVLQGIQKLQQYQLIVNPACRNTIVELENYSWKRDKATNEYVNEPQDSYNHALDSLRYSIQAQEKKQKIQTISKLGLGL